LTAIARQRLLAVGVASISSAAVDTRSDPRFYSYRRAAVTGRFASLIWRE
jgi:copper oxidase (laccase) domain-containing protein